MTEEGFGQALGFATEKKKVAVAVVGVPKRSVGFGGEHPGAGRRPGSFEKMGPGIPDVDVAFVPVVHAGTAEGFFIKGKSEGSDQMQTGSCGETKAGDVAGVGRDFRFDQDHVKHAGRVIPGKEIAKGIQELPALAL